MIRSLTRFKALSAVLLLAMLTVFVVPLRSEAARGMDEILFYGVECHVQESGSVEITYTIDWKVLKEDSQGGVRWVKIGIPNANAEKFTPLTSNIKSVRFMNDGGVFARVDFRNEYHAGETFHFKFSILQHNLFEKPRYDSKSVVKNNTLMNDVQLWDILYTYTFTPGWFPEIFVDNYELKWDATKVAMCEAALSGGYYVKKGSLGPNEKTSIRVGYPKDAFDYTTKKIHHFEGLGDALKILFQIVVIVVVIWIRIKFGDIYVGHGHYGGYHGGGGGCACACACACAGGGRAGCSKKDFYAAKVSARRLRKALKDGAKDAESETV